MTKRGDDDHEQPRPQAAVTLPAGGLLGFGGSATARQTSAGSGQAPFCGREAELRLVEQTWAEVRQGTNGPRVVVLVADQGLGKTRLVQELYERLAREASAQATEEGEASYWPMRLGQEGDNLAINPPPLACNQLAPLPFLWWGVRLADPGGYNQVATGALPGHVEAYLVPQLEPLAREQRRRQTRTQLLRLGGSVAADMALDLAISAVPLIGLVKKAAEVGAELRGLAVGYRRDSAGFDAEAFGAQRRASLVDQVVADLGRLFGGPAGRRVPGVLVIDDGQFSGADASVVALVRELIGAMSEGRWPLLIVVTHWEREWVEAERRAEAQHSATSQDTVADVVLRHGRTDLGGLQVVRLKPVSDLTEALIAGLPGLTIEQQDALLARVGGNPRLLDELLRYARSGRGRAAFEGRNPEARLTASGLQDLANRSMRLEELVGERMAATPEAVQLSLAMASLQGSDFVGELVALTAAELTGDHSGGIAAAVSEGLGLADESYGYVTATSGALSAFRQRMYLGAARELLVGLVDPEVARAASAAAVRRVLTNPELLKAWPEQLALMGHAADLFEDADATTDLRFAAAALHQLMRAMRGSGDLLAAAANARRLADVLVRLPDELLDGDLAWPLDAEEVLASVGSAEDIGARSELLQRLVALTDDAMVDDVNLWSVGLHASVMLQVQAFHTELGEVERADHALTVAVATMERLPVEEYDLDTVVTARAVYDRLGDRHFEGQELLAAQAAFEHAMHLAQVVSDMRDGSLGARWALAVAKRKVGKCAFLAGDAEAATVNLSAAADELRDLWALTQDPSAAVSLAATLDDLAETHVATNDHYAAAELLLESHALVFELHRAAPAAFDTRSNLADSSVKLARVYLNAGAHEEALAYATEAVDLRRANTQQSPSRRARADLGYACTLAALSCSKLGRLQEAGRYSKEAVELQLSFADAYPASTAAWLLLNALAVRIPVVWDLEGESAARALFWHVDETTAALEPEQYANVESVLLKLAAVRAALGAARGEAN